MIESAKCLQNIVETKNMSQKEKELISNVIAAFSEYVVAADEEYKYNKSFLIGFTDDFMVSLEQLRIKKRCLEEKILKPLEDSINDTIVVVDDAWIFENGKINLKNHFHIRDINSNKIRYQIKYMGEPQFIIAREVKMEDIDKAMREDAERFKNRTVEQKNG